MKLKRENKHSAVLLSFFILAAIAILFVSAQEEAPEATAEETPYDYADNNNYQNPDFYRDPDSDPAQWDWSQVDWVVFDFERADVYDVPEFYTNLPVERYSDLNYRLVPDFELYIPDHSLIDGNKYVQDFGCMGCSFEAEVHFENIEGDTELIDEIDNLIYDADGSIFHTTTGQYIYAGEFPAGVSFLATLSGFEVRYPEGVTEIVPPVSGGWYTIAIEGREMEFQGNTVSGYLSFRENQPYVDGFDTLTINGIAIANFGETDTSIYFDGLEHEGDYISLGGPLAMGGDRIVIGSASGDTNYGFQSGNDFFDVPAGEDGDVAANTLFFEPGAGSRIIIEDRSEEQLIPQVTVYPDKNVWITNGATQLILGRENNQVLIRGGEHRSTPFALRYLTRERVSAAGNPRIVYDQRNNYIIVSEEEIPAAQLECFDCALDFRNNRVLYDHYTAQILERYNIFFLYENEDPLVLRSLIETLEVLPPEIVASIRFLTIVPDEDLEGYCGENTGGCAFPEYQSIVIPESFSQELIHHEGAHALTGFIAVDDQLNILEEQQTVQRLLETYGSLENAPQDIWVEIVREAAARPAYFLPRWQRTVGGEQFYEEMRTFLGEATVGGNNAPTWRDGEYGPRFGCFTAYACNNEWEDIAETAERVRAGETEGIPVRELLDPASIYYQKRMGSEIGDTGIIMTPEVAEDWARRSRARVEVAYDEGFISDEDYQQVRVLIIEPQEIIRNDEEEVGAGEGP